MVTNDKGIVSFKHKIMEEVCRLAWNGALNEHEKEQLVLRMVPGPKSEYCCIYKEREIVRERIRLALAECPSDMPASDNVVQVINAACDDCPISAYSVTDSCRFCLGRPCINSCRFNAITPGEFRMHIDSAKCKECGQCAKACPYGAIVHLERPCKKACPVGAITYDDWGFCRINEEKCIQCGHCIHNCPFGAIGSKTYLVHVINAILDKKEVIAMCAPATEGQFGDKISMASVKNALKKLGFADMVEVGLGGDMTAANEALEWAEAYRSGKKMTTSCCSAFINMLRQHFPDVFKNNMSDTVSPMCAISRYLKATHPGCVTVFIGPCIAKKSEANDPTIPDNADYVMTYGELRSLMRSRDIDFEEVPAEYQEASLWGKRFATSGGVANAVLECMAERGENVSDIKLLRCAGGDECKKALTKLKFGSLEEDFVEGMVCPGGCVGGPSKHKTETEIARARETLLKKADGRLVLENLKQYPMDLFSMNRSGHKEPRTENSV